MQPVVLLCSEPMRATMAGIGIRYLEMARRLSARGFPVRLLSPFASEEDRAEVAAAVGGEALIYRDGPIGPLLAGARAIVGQGQLVNEVIHQGVEMPLVVDLYDPWLVENLHYAESLGLDPYRNDHATWMLQLSAGDLFLCSSEEQWLFYSGLLVAAGRVHPESMSADPALERLLRVVPFGVPSEPNHHGSVLPARSEEECRVLFGGLYDWYDPWTLLGGFERAVKAEPETTWRLFIVHNPNAGTPQRLVREVERWVRARGMADNVRFLDWLPAHQRYDLLRDVDVLAATHRDSLETRLSMRTRFLDALAVDCQILTTEGGAMSRLLVEADAGWVVPEGDEDAVCRSLCTIARGGEAVTAKRCGAETLRNRFSWDHVLQPLVEFLEAPERDPSKADFAQRLPTEAPPDGLSFRARRRLRRTWNALSRGRE